MIHQNMLKETPLGWKKVKVKLKLKGLSSRITGIMVQKNSIRNRSPATSRLIIDKAFVTGYIRCETTREDTRLEIPAPDIEWGEPAEMDFTFT
jgi:hypothetical protein